MLRKCATLGRALAVGVLVLTTGCDLEQLFGGGGARMQVVLSRDGGNALGDIVADVAADAAASRNGRGNDDDGNQTIRGTWSFRTANVTLSSILVRTNEGELVELDVDLPITVDVVRIDGGRQIELPDGFLPADTYDQVVLVMTAVRGVTNDGTTVTIEPPGGGWTAVIPICPLEVTEGTTTTVGLALNVRNSFIQSGNWWSFQPRFRSLVDCDDDDDEDDN